MTQSEQILVALQRGERVTPHTAHERWGCLALHSRIAELRERGYRIECQIVTGNGRRWGEYRLIRELPYRDQIALFTCPPERV